MSIRRKSAPRLPRRPAPTTYVFKMLSVAAAVAFFIVFAVSLYYSSVKIDGVAQGSSAIKSMALQSQSDERSRNRLSPPPMDRTGGYLLFCLCMGRYGNQMEQLLGVLGESKRRSPNRIIVLPSFISYNHPRHSYIPLEEVFRIDKLREFYPKMITMDEFLSIAKSIPRHTDHSESYWDPKYATVYCNILWASRPSFVCNQPRQTAPGSYWHSIGINFTSHYYHDGEAFDLDPDQHPIIALNGAPAPFPMRSEDRVVAKFLRWTVTMERRIDQFLVDSGIHLEADNGDSVRIVAAHLRAGSDWVKACQHAVGRTRYMASPQCSEETKQQMKRPDHALNITQDICLPTYDMARLASSLRSAGEKVGMTMDTQGEHRLILFVASDIPTLGIDLMEKHELKSIYDSLIGQSSSESPQQHAHGIQNDGPLLDLALMTRADYFIGNCVSSFTSFAARIRREQSIGLGTDFFGLVDG